MKKEHLEPEIEWRGTGSVPRCRTQQFGPSRIKPAFRLFQKIWNHLTAGSKRTSRPISGNFWALSCCRAEQVQVETVERLDGMFLIGCYFPVNFFLFWDDVVGEYFPPDLGGIGWLQLNCQRIGAEILGESPSETLKQRRVKVLLESCNLSRVGGREDTPQEAAKPGKFKGVGALVETLLKILCICHKMSN